MEREKLLATLAALHEELTLRPAMDPDAKKGLQILARDIETILQGDSPVAPNSPTSADVQKRLGTLVEQFEAEHPRITSLLSQVTDLLSSMGI